MLEFCYFGNFIVYFTLIFMPENKYLYYASFAFANGPLGWALALVGCKFVLHSVDKLTTVFIHFTPMTLMWNMHWKTQYNANKPWPVYDAKLDTFSLEFLKDYYTGAIGFYLVWAVVYYIIMFVIAKRRIKERGYGNLKIYYESSNPKVKKTLNKYGEKYSGIMYLLYHFSISMFSSTLALASYFSFYVHCLLMIGLVSTCFWNGATYYMDHFSKKYEVNLTKMDEIQKKIDEELSDINAKKDE